MDQAWTRPKRANSSRNQNCSKSTLGSAIPLLSPVRLHHARMGENNMGFGFGYSCPCFRFPTLQIQFRRCSSFCGRIWCPASYHRPAVRWRWFDFITRTAKSFNYPLILWDSGADDFNCPENTWNDPVTLDVWFNAATRINNTLADSTTDQQATSQITSASIFHKVGEVVYPQSVTYLMDGNTLTSVKTPTGTALNSS